ncbi:MULTISPECIES: hypothetical protein [Streptomyces]|uniref:hypothetical protein n=1 Tax=Streptomyces TaxID=1883 RepID=UPI0033D58250
MCDPADLPQQLVDELAVLKGLEARLHSDVPFRGIIADRRIALVTMDREPQNATAIVVRPSPLLDGLVLLFDTCWSRARSPSARTRSRSTDRPARCSNSSPPGSRTRRSPAS